MSETVITPSTCHSTNDTHSNGFISSVWVKNAVFYHDMNMNYMCLRIKWSGIYSDLGRMIWNTT